MLVNIFLVYTKKIIRYQYDSKRDLISIDEFSHITF